jgi:hypothetical protein
MDRSASGPQFVGAGPTRQSSQATRLKAICQLVSQVLPASAEKACSQCAGAASAAQMQAAQARAQAFDRDMAAYQRCAGQEVREAQAHGDAAEARFSQAEIREAGALRDKVDADWRAQLARNQKRRPLDVRAED